MKNRVHGNNIIKRRTVTDKKRYELRRKILEEDFKGICGYCAKSSKIFLEKFQIDHFAPQSKFPERKNDYDNLVLSCPCCNRLKSDKWLTENSHIYYTEKEGFIDPASEEFDKHLGRKENGEIFPKTDIGKYMCEIFRFEIRPIKIIWKIMRLRELRDQLENDNSKKGLLHYKEVTKILDDYIDYIKFEKRE